MKDEDKDSEKSSDSARENLQVIRELMERATVYRAVSTIPALVGGVLAVAVSLVLFIFRDSVGKTAFVLSWLGVLIAAGALNTWLFYRDCRTKGAEFPSPQMKHGLLAMGPPMIVMGCIGFVTAGVHGQFGLGSVFWVLGYGLGLLATSSFAPESIKKLGRHFLIFGVGFYILHELGFDHFGEKTIANSCYFMALSFGLLHLSYAFHTWRDARRAG